MQEWNEKNSIEAVQSLSSLISQPKLVNVIAYCFPQYILDILTLALESGISHELKCVLLGNLCQIHPDVLRYIHYVLTIHYLKMF